MSDAVVDYFIGVLSGVKPDSWRLACLPMLNASIVFRNDSSDVDDWISVEDWGDGWCVKACQLNGVWASVPFDIGDHESVVDAFRLALDC